MGGDMEAISCIYDGSVWNGNSPYVNGNGENRKLNLNTRENDWNSNYLFAAVSQSLHSSLPTASGELAF